MLRLASLLVASASAQTLCLKLRELGMLDAALKVRDVGIAIQDEITNHIKSRGGSAAAESQVLS